MTSSENVSIIPLSKKFWVQLNILSSGMTTTRIRAITPKFDTYMMDPKHTMDEHLRIVSATIHDVKLAGKDLSDDQRLATIRPYPIIGNPQS